MPHGEVLEVVATTQDALVILSPHLFISVVDGDPTVEGTRAQSACARKLVGKPRGSIGCLVVLGPSTTPPSAEMRKEIPMRLLELASFTSGFAIVIESDGFRGAALRGVFTGFLMLRRLPYQAEVFRTAKDALVWLSTRTDFDPDDALSQLGHIRQRHGMMP